MSAARPADRLQPHASKRGRQSIIAAAQPITAAAVLRVGMHTLPGWGAEPVTDEAAEVGELPETAEEDQRIFWYQFAPAVAALAVPIFLLCVPGWLATLRGASAHFSQQAAMLHWIYTGSQVHAQNIAPWEVGTAAIHGGVAFLLAVLLACTSVFRDRLARPLRIGAFLEAGFAPLRAMQSGHPGDYVFWITVGLAAWGSAVFILIR